MKNSKRIVWVDIVKYFCIVFVMLSHLGNNSIAPELRQFYSNFFLTGFLFTSGYVYKFKIGFKEHFVKKTKQLLIPWFTFSTLIILSSQILTFNPERHDRLIVEFEKNFLQVRAYGDHMWFVAALFVAYVFMYFFVKMYEKYKIKNEKSSIIIFSVIAVGLYFVNKTYNAIMPPELFPWKTAALPWHIQYVPYALCFMFFGYLFRTNFEEKYDKTIGTTTCFVLAVIYLCLVFVPVSIGINMSWQISAVYSFITCFLALVVLVYIAKHIKPNNYFSYVGQNTLIYFGLHGKVLAVLEMLFRKLLPEIYEYTYSSHLASAVYSIGIGLLVSVVLIFPAMIINRYLPFMMGKSISSTKK